MGFFSRMKVRKAIKEGRKEVDQEILSKQYDRMLVSFESWHKANKHFFEKYEKGHMRRVMGEMGFDKWRTGTDLIGEDYIDPRLEK